MTLLIPTAECGKGGKIGPFSQLRRHGGRRPMKSTEQVTQLLSSWRTGDRAAFDSLFSLVYDELRAMASSYMSRERPDHTLQTTALVNEAYIKLVGQSDALWEH